MVLVAVISSRAGDGLERVAYRGWGARTRSWHRFTARDVDGGGHRGQQRAVEGAGWVGCEGRLRQAAHRGGGDDARIDVDSDGRLAAVERVGQLFP